MKQDMSESLGDLISQTDLSTVVKGLSTWLEDYANDPIMPPDLKEKQAFLAFKNNVDKLVNEAKHLDLRYLRSTRGN